jgi:hypothetical protein
MATKKAPIAPKNPVKFVRNFLLPGLGGEEG